MLVLEWKLSSQGIWICNYCIDSCMGGPMYWYMSWREFIISIIIGFLDGLIRKEKFVPLVALLTKLKVTETTTIFRLFAAVGGDDANTISQTDLKVVFGLLKPDTVVGTGMFCIQHLICFCWNVHWSHHYSHLMTNLIYDF